MLVAALCTNETINELGSLKAADTAANANTLGSNTTTLVPVVPVVQPVYPVTSPRGENNTQLSKAQLLVTEHALPETS